MAPFDAPLGSVRSLSGSAISQSGTALHGADLDAQPPASVRPLRLYRCRECAENWPLAELNQDMLCASCGEAEEDPEYTLDLSPAAMLAAHGTWSI